jgi:aldehyde dehydrogenase (NAD+)
MAITDALPFPAIDAKRASDEIDRLFEAQRLMRHRVAATTSAERIEKLRALEKALFARRDDIRAAMFADYRKPHEETDLSEIYPVLIEARHARRHLRRWMKPRRVSAPLALFGTRSRIMHEPKGVVLIISPWNFPFNLTLGPLVSAIAAGNCAIVKPSEMTPHAAACIASILEELFDPAEVAVIEGDAKTATALLSKPFDHIFFTGSPAVGKSVMRAAAEHLTSVTLELGGKSPAIVDVTADLDEAAAKIAWGKYLNSGQICVAPDYLLVHRSIADDFALRLQRSVETMFRDAGSRGGIVNERHHERLSRALAAATERGATVLSGGTTDPARNDFGPTILTGVAPDAQLLQDEIFGPVLPIVPYDDLEGAIRLINEKEKPLSLYVFSHDRSVIDRVLAGTSAGGTAINDTVVQFFHTGLPFGGVGNSGIGRAHGFFGFEAFSNIRGVFEQSLRRTPLQLMYPPYNAFKRRLIDLTLRFL